MYESQREVDSSEPQIKVDEKRIPQIAYALVFHFFQCGLPIRANGTHRSRRLSCFVVSGAAIKAIHGGLSYL